MAGLEGWRDIPGDWMECFWAKQQKTEKGKDGLLTNNLWMVFSGAMLVPVGLTLCDFWGQDAIL